MNLADSYRAAHVPFDDRRAWLDRGSRLRVTSWGNPVPAWVGIAALVLQMALLVGGIKSFGEAVAPLLCFSASAIGFGANLRFRRERDVSAVASHGEPVSAVAPRDGDMLLYDGHRWAPTCGPRLPERDVQ